MIQVSPTTIVKTVATAGAAEKLTATSVKCVRAVIQAYEANTGAVVIGDSATDIDGGFSFANGVNDVIRVTDDGGGPVDVDILSGTGATLAAGIGYTATEVCAGLKAVLDGDTTLSQTYTITFSTATRKFTIAHAGATLSLHWSHANSNMQDTLGFDDSGDDTGSTSYTGDYAIKGNRGVRLDGGESVGLRMIAGQFYDLTEHYIDVATNGDGVAITYWT